MDDLGCTYYAAVDFSADVFAIAITILNVLALSGEARTGPWGLPGAVGVHRLPGCLQ